MRLLAEIKAILNAPFPESKNFLEEARGLVTAGLIVSFMLFVFQPFGLSNYPDSKLALSLRFGAITFIAGIMITLITRGLKKQFKLSEKFTFGKWLLEGLILFIFIAIGNLLFMKFSFGGNLSWNAFFLMLLNTTLIGVFPLVFFGMQTQIKAERKNKALANDLNNTIGLTHEVTNNTLLVEAMQNYVNVYSLIDGELKKNTERLTLKAALIKYESEGLTKCHRSYLVNLKEVKSVSGNAQGLKLKLTHEECPEVPVSRTFTSSVRHDLNSISRL